MTTADKSEDAVSTYVRALVEDPAAALSVLRESAVFRSPFNTWRGDQLRNVFHARRKAFTGLRVDRVLRDGQKAVILWRATVSDHEVEGAEVLSLRSGIVDRVDVFLRPSDVLAVVHRAMSDAWPLWHHE